MNVYGVVLDATFPHKSFKSEKYICSFKIADMSSPVDKNGIVKHTSVVFLAKRFDDMPVCQRIGEIIRIHRTTVGTFKDNIQLAVNMFFNSSWAMFPPFFVADETKKTKKLKLDEIVPLAFSGKAMSTNLKEQKTLNALRQWTSK